MDHCLASWLSKLSASIIEQVHVVWLHKTFSQQPVVWLTIVWITFAHEIIVWIAVFWMATARCLPVSSVPAVPIPVATFWNTKILHCFSNQPLNGVCRPSRYAFSQTQVEDEDQYDEEEEVLSPGHAESETPGHAEPESPGHAEPTAAETNEDGEKTSGYGNISKPFIFTSYGSFVTIRWKFNAPHRSNSCTRRWTYVILVTGCR